MPDARGAMIDSAIALFRERGVAATSLRDVVEHSGAPRGSIYHHFPGGKDELAEAAARRAGEVMAALLEGLVAGDDPALAVRKVVDHWCGVLESSGFEQSCPVAASALAPQDVDGARRAAGRAFGSWERILTEALAARGVPADRAASLATLVVCSVEGAILVSRASGSTDPLRRVGESLGAALTAP